MSTSQQLAYAVVSQFGDVPHYTRLLTAGDQAIVELPSDASKLLVAVDLGGSAAQLLVVEEAGQVASLALQGALRTVKAKLRERGYKLGSEMRVTAGVLAEVLRNPGQATQSAGQGEPIALFRRWVGLSIKQGASDIHIEFSEQAAKVRVRVDGTLLKLSDDGQISYSRAGALDAVAAGYNTTRLGNSSSDYDASKPADCIINHSEGGDCELRFTSFPGRYGPKVTMRIQRVSDRRVQGDFAGAGYSPSQQRLWKKAARIGKGLVLITGSVNSGKSSSLQTFIETLPELECQAVYTVEDPIERQIFGTHQIEVLRDPNDPVATQERFGGVIRGLLRGDMDAVMLGEIRDALSANFFLQVGQTGHLAMGTLHAHFLSSIAARLSNDKMGLTREELTAPKVVNLLVYQALLPHLCTHCRVPAVEVAREDEEVGDMLRMIRKKFRLNHVRFFVKRPGGCVECEGRGTRGRVVVAEMFQPDRRWLELTRAGDDYAANLHYRSLSDRDFTSDDLTGKTVFEHALLRAWKGEIDLRMCEEFETFERFEMLEEAVVA